jgi:hypothetical protein
MISAKALDADVLRTYLATLYAELSPIERRGAIGKLGRGRSSRLSLARSPGPWRRKSVHY